MKRHPLHDDRFVALVNRGEVGPEHNTGRSTAQALGFIAGALRAPYARMRLEDHYPGRGADANLAHIVAAQISRLGLLGVKVRRDAGGFWIQSSVPEPPGLLVQALGVLIQAIRNPETKIRIQAPGNTDAANSALACVVDSTVGRSGLKHLHLSRTPNRRWFLTFENRERDTGGPQA